MLRIKRIYGLMLVGLLGACAAFADAVTDWNDITVQAVLAGRPGTIGIVDIALVQVAVHDAVQVIDRQFEPYHAEIETGRGGGKGRRSAAVAAAAHDVLVGMYPAQATSLDTTYFNYLADRGLNGDPGILVGQRVAARILPLRRVNPNPLPPPFVGGNVPGTWRPTPSFLGNPPTPPPFSPMATPWMAEFDPFTLTSPTRFRAPPPPALTSDRYTRDYNEVKEIGSLASVRRTVEQTDLAYFYSDNFPAQWNRALRGIADRNLRRSGDTARLFALANLATADALITSWDSKKFYAAWRPITAIQEGDADGNPATIGDPAWQSLINNPNYPDYSSGANSVTGAMTRTLELFFGTDRFAFEVTSLAPQAVLKARRYYRFSDAAQDVVDARIYLGIHFRFADLAARTQGRSVADWTFNHFLLPLDDRDHHGQDK
ncbi:MAG: vanadium-dependent haloperoxidase [Pseudomonadota bacterium]